MRNREILFIIRMRNQARAALRGLNTDLRKTAKAARGASTKMNKLSASAAKSGIAMKGAGAGATAFGAGLGRAGVAAKGLLLALAPLIGVIGLIGAIKTIGDFEKQMQAVLAITGATGKEFKALEDEARRLGATTVFSATEAAAGMEFLARAGFNATQVVASLEDTLNLAIAGNLGLAEAADIVSNVMQAFGLETSKTAAAADILAFTAASTNTNIQQLGEAMKLAAPIARSLGISLNETSAAVGVLGNAGVQASLAGTGLRQTFLRLIDTTPKATKALKTLGLTFADVDPRTKSLADIFKVFKAAGLDATRAIQIFGIRTSGTSLILTEAAERLGQLTEETKRVGGFAAETARIMQDNLTDSFKALVSAIQEAIIVTGKQGFGSALRTAIVTVTEAVRILSGFEGATEKASRAAKVLAGVIKFLAGAFVAFIGVKIVSGLLGLVGTFGKLTLAIKAARTAQIGLNLAMLLNPIGLVIAAVAVLAGGIFLLTRNTEELTEGQRDLARSTEELKTIRESAAASTEVGVRKQLKLLNDQRTLLGDQIDEARARAKEAKKNIKEGFLAALFPPTESRRAANEAEAALSKVLSALSAVNQATDSLSSSLRANSTDLDGNRKKVDALAKALKAAGITEVNFAVALEGTLDGLIKGRKATRDNEVQLTRLNKALKLSPEILEILQVSRAELQQAIDKLTLAEKDNLTVVEATLKSLRQEIILAGLSAEQRKVELAVIQARTKALAEGQKFGPEEAKRIREAAQALADEVKNRKEAEKFGRKQAAAVIKQAKALKNFNIQLDQTIAGIDLETANIGKSNEARRRATIIQRELNKAKRAGITDGKKLAEVEDRITAALDRQAVAEQKKRGDAIAGAKAGLKSFIDEAQDLNSQFESFTTNALSNLSDAITQFAETGKFSFKDLANSALADLQRIASKGIVADLAGAFGFGGSTGQRGGGSFGISGLLGSLFARGGVVGRDGVPAVFPAAAFARAQRFAHGGVVERRGTDSVPILASPGEVVLTEDQARFLSRALSAQNVGGMPPQRMATQPLGGVDAREVSNNVTVVMNITTPDVGGFRRSQGQIGAEAAASINRSLRRNG